MAQHSLSQKHGQACSAGSTHPLRFLQVASSLSVQQTVNERRGELECRLETCLAEVDVATTLRILLRLLRFFNSDISQSSRGQLPSWKQKSIQLACTSCRSTLELLEASIQDGACTHQAQYGDMPNSVRSPTTAPKTMPPGLKSANRPPKSMLRRNMLKAKLEELSRFCEETSVCTPSFRATRSSHTGVHDDDDFPEISVQPATWKPGLPKLERTYASWFREESTPRVRGPRYVEGRDPSTKSEGDKSIIDAALQGMAKPFKHVRISLFSKKLDQMKVHGATRISESISNLGTSDGPKSLDLGMKVLQTVNVQGTRASLDLGVGHCWHYFQLHPLGLTHRLWDGITFCVLVFLLFYLPVRVAFVDDGSDREQEIDFIISVVFVIDIVVNFMTGVVLFDADKEEEYISFSFRDIWIKYSQGWLFIDLVSVLPWSELFSFIIAGHNSWGKVPSFFKLIRLTRLLKVLKVAEGGELFKMLMQFIPATIRQLLKLGYGVALLAHYVACCWHYIAVEQNNQGKATWMGIYFEKEADDVDFAERYVTSLYWSLTTITTVGYGDVLPYTKLEKMFSVTIMYLGVSVSSVMVSKLNTL
ncbi:hypothetical protein CYMTET_42893, partial [Cymbomonas tetramitiformis]